MHPCPTTYGEVHQRAKRVGDSGIWSVYAGNGEGMVFANNIVRALLSIRSQIAVGQVVAGQTTMSRDSRPFENYQRGTWKWTSLGANLVAALTALL